MGVKTELYEVYEDVIDKLGFPLFKNIPARQQAISSRTIGKPQSPVSFYAIPCGQSTGKGKLDALINEMLETLK